jgi:hypothetical protein
MTVCAGFLCTDGLIIGADTEMSGGAKYHASKVRRVEFSAGEYALTGTGNKGFIGMAATTISAALRSKQQEFDRATDKDEQAEIFHAAVKAVIRRIHKDFMHLLDYAGGLPYLELIIGVHFKGKYEQVKLMHCAHDSSVDWIDHHIATGSGLPIAMRFLTILAPGPRPVDVMSAVAFLCIAEAKLSSTGVGGDSELIKFPHPPGPILQTWYAESPLVEIAEEALQLAVCAPREKLTDEVFEARLKAFSDKLWETKKAVDRAPESERITLELIRMARSELDKKRPTP